ncbi:MAG: alpha/beta fold hydrolase [Ruminococcus sp.]|nr:alpha/beta fold hydrolase [Ruminococcus sp.]
MSGYFPYYKNSCIAGRTKCLLCFHHAGGNASVFLPLRRFDNEGFVTVAAELPGHGRRVREAPITDLDLLIEQLAEETAELFSGCELYLYGHSFGSIIAFELCRKLEKDGISPAALIVTGRNAPDETEPSPFRLEQGDEALAAEMKRYGFIPDELLSDRDFMSCYLPMVKADYMMIESYSFTQGSLISAPIYFSYGSEDPDLRCETADRWGLMTTGVFRKEVRSGGHFFVFEKGNTFFEDLIRNITGIKADF